MNVSLCMFFLLAVSGSFLIQQVESKQKGRCRTDFKFPSPSNDYIEFCQNASNFKTYEQYVNTFKLEIF